LQKQADRIRQKEVEGVVERIKEAIAHYELTVEDLFGESSSRVRVAPAKQSKVMKGLSPRKKKSPVAFPKYHLEGQTWGGQGRRPKWFVDAVAAGRTPEEMLVQDLK